MKSRTRLSDFTFTFHFHALEKEMATHSSVLAWRIPGTGEPGGLLSMGSHRHNWHYLAAAHNIYCAWIILKPFPIPSHRRPWKSCLPWNWFLVSKGWGPLSYRPALPTLPDALVWVWAADPSSGGISTHFRWWIPSPWCLILLFLKHIHTSQT